MKVVEIDKMWMVSGNARGGKPVLAMPDNPCSVTVIRVFDQETQRTHYARYHGVNSMVDFLPGGQLYLGDTWDDAMKTLGFQEEKRA